MRSRLLLRQRLTPIRMPPAPPCVPAASGKPRKNTKMEATLKAAFETEMASARSLIHAGLLDAAMDRLETAHVLGQGHVMPHVRSHWAMLRIAARRRLLADACGQAMRIVLGAAGSALGLVPTGNTGSSAVSMFRRMPIAPRIAALLERDRKDGES
jgi:hypothetical protein